MEHDYSKLGLSTAELFSKVDHSDLESEKITAPLVVNEIRGSTVVMSMSPRMMDTTLSTA